MPFVPDRNRRRKPDRSKIWTQIASTLIAVVGLVLGVSEFSSTQSADAEKLRQTQAVEAARPYLEKKLKWCEEATEIAAELAVNPTSAPPKSEERFWELYWGVMGMIEESSVERAMVRYGNALSLHESLQLPPLALSIAHACRDEMAREWSPAWRR